MSDERKAIWIFLSLITHRFLVVSTADEMNNLDLILLFERGARPLCAADDFAVAFDRETFGREREMLYQAFDCEPVWNVAPLAVDRNLQNSPRLLSLALLDDAPQLCLVAADGRAYQDCGTPASEVRQLDAESGDAVGTCA